MTLGALRRACRFCCNVLLLEILRELEGVRRGGEKGIVHREFESAGSATFL